MCKYPVVPVVLILLLTTALVHADADVETLISHYDLQVADSPVSERADWQTPRKILIAGADHQRLNWLREAVPDVELVGVANNEEALEAVGDADALVGLCSAKLLDAGKDIRWIQMMTAGVERCINLEQVEERKPLITNMARVTGPVIAEHILGLMFALTRGLYPYAQEQLVGNWNPNAPGENGMQVIQGKTMLVVGLGGIGTETARRAHALGMRVTAIRASRPEGPDYIEKVGLPEDLDEMITEADVVVNALPLTDDTSDLFDARLFERMKPTALFINVGRGGTVVTDDLIQALKNGDIAGAGLDVTEPSPLPQEHPLWIAPNTIITPHVAARSDLGREARWQVVRENLRRYAAGKPMLSVVDLERGY